MAISFNNDWLSLAVLAKALMQNVTVFWRHFETAIFASPPDKQLRWLLSNYIPCMFTVQHRTNIRGAGKWSLFHITSISTNKFMTLFLSLFFLIYFPPTHTCQLPDLMGDSPQGTWGWSQHNIHCCTILSQSTETTRKFKGNSMNMRKQWNHGFEILET